MNPVRSSPWLRSTSHRIGKILPVAVLCLLGAAMMSPCTARAAYYNTYTTVDVINNSPNSCNSMQGFDVGSTYVYSIKRNSDDSKAVIYRTNMSDGTTTLMTNGDNGTNYATYLGHGNDLSLKSINGDYYMFVATLPDTSGVVNLVKVKYVGTTYYKIGTYTVKYNGADLAVSGVKDTSADASNIYFLFKKGTKYYRGSLPLTANSGAINVSLGFTINIVDALVDGSKISGIDGWNHQGYAYSSAKNRIYHVLTEPGGNVSVILVYNNISTASGTITSDPNLSFRITSGTYAHFEIEGCGIGPDKKLWFNTDRSDDNDGVHYFDGFVEN